MDTLHLLAAAADPGAGGAAATTGKALNDQGFCSAGMGPLGILCDTAKSDAGAGFSALSRVISIIIGFITLTAGIYFLFQIIVGGVGWMSSTGDKNKLQQAQDRMTNAFIGLVIVVGAYAITWVVGNVFGLDIFISDPAGVVGQLGL